MPDVVLVEGPDRGKVFAVDGGATIGRDRTCAVRLPGRHLSRVHARIERRADGLYLVDADSRNGIFVNGRKVKEHLLRRDDEIEIGEFVLVFDPGFDPKVGLPQRMTRTVATVQETLGSPFTEPVSDPELRAAFERLQVVLETAELLHAIDDEVGATKALLERVMAHVRAPRGFVMLVDAGGKPVPAAKSAPPGQDEFTVSNVIHHQVSRERRALLGYDVARGGPHAGKPVSILCAPLVARDRYLGFLYLDGPRESTTFRRADLHFAAALASVGATVLSNLRRNMPEKRCDVERIWRREIALPRFLVELERDCIEEALRRSGGDILKAADLVRLPPPQFEAKLKEHGIGAEPPPTADWKSVEV
ncbi:MAG: FHA domain-containing protein [Planctomycetes bacterium]|nr:FHA domain-containing protein [Planctomycetota bacterium]